MTKGVRIEGRDGLWEAVNLSAPGTLAGMYDVEVSIGFDHRDNYVLLRPDLRSGKEAWSHIAVFRRLPEPKPMPELQIGDLVRLSGDASAWKSVVEVQPYDRVKVFMGTGYLQPYVAHFCKEHFDRVWRDGEIIWRREEA